MVKSEYSNCRLSYKKLFNRSSIMYTNNICLYLESLWFFSSISFSLFSTVEIWFFKSLFMLGILSFSSSISLLRFLFQSRNLILHVFFHTSNLSGYEISTSYISLWHVYFLKYNHSHMNYTTQTKTAQKITIKHWNILHICLFFTGLQGYLQLVFLKKNIP